MEEEDEERRAIEGEKPLPREQYESGWSAYMHVCTYYKVPTEQQWKWF